MVGWTVSPLRLSRRRQSLIEQTDRPGLTALTSAIILSSDARSHRSLASRTIESSAWLQGVPLPGIWHLYMWPGVKLL